MSCGMFFWLGITAALGPSFLILAWLLWRY